MNEFMEKKSSKDRADSVPMNVYIWDMDETLILLKSLLDGTYARAFNGRKDVRKGIEIGKRWENHILQTCDELFFYEEIENYNEPYLNSLIRFDDGRDLSNYDFTIDGFGLPFDFINKRKLAYRHRYIAGKYAQGLHKVIDKEMIETWNDLYSLTDSYTDGWLSSGRALLNQVVGRDNITKNGSQMASDCITTVGCQNVNILVTSGSLIPSLVKCLLYRLDDAILPHHVYSSWEVGKLQCFSWIKESFAGPNVRFCVMGDGTEEREAAETMMWPFVKIDLQPTTASAHRFPGLTLKTIQSYINVAYGLFDAATEDEDE